MGLRLGILNDGHSPVQKGVLRLIRSLSDGQVPGPVLVMSYRRSFFGKRLADSIQDAMRQATSWSTGETELFAAFVSKLNQCEY